MHQKLQTSYIKNYVRIYLWQAISLALGLLSLFLIMPLISKDKNIFGVYSICVSFSIFLSYVDLGFVAAAQKYAAEYFARNDPEREIETIGFTACVLILFTFIAACIFFCFGLWPSSIVNKLSDENSRIASDLFFILAAFTFVIIPQRVCQLLFSARVEDYIYYRITAIFNLVRILSIYLFIRGDKVDLVAYFFFQQSVGALSALTALMTGIRRYNIKFAYLIKNIRFNASIFRAHKKLALNSLFLTICWILYYELDSIVIGKFFGAKDVAVFAVGLTLLSFVRSILGVIFSPFIARFNHFHGLGDQAETAVLLKQVIKYTFPVVVFPLVSLAIFAKAFVLAWVGDQYVTSVPIVRWLLLCNLFAFISYPASILLTALERVDYLYPVNAIMPIVYWTGSVLTYRWWGIEAFAGFKFLSFFINGTFLTLFVSKYLNIKLPRILIFLIKGSLPSLLVLSAAYCLSSVFPVLPKGSRSLAIIVGVTSAISFICLICYGGAVLRAEIAAWFTPRVRLRLKQIT